MNVVKLRNKIFYQRYSAKIQTFINVKLLNYLEFKFR